MDIDQNGFKDYYEVGVGIALTNDIGVKQLIERHDVDLYIPLQFNHVGGYFIYDTAYYKWHGMPPDEIISLSIYDPFYIMNKTYGFGDQYDDHFPGGSLWSIPGLPMYHQMTYSHTLNYGDWTNHPMSYNLGGVLYLKPRSWHHADIYYAGVTGLLNVFVDGQLVRARLYMPALHPEKDPTLENIWFYNYGMQTTYISNLEVLDNIPPMVTPFKSSVVNINRLTTEQSISNPILIDGPYQYGATNDNSMFYLPQTNLISNCNGFLYSNPYVLNPSIEIGQTVNLGLEHQRLYIVAPEGTISYRFSLNGTSTRIGIETGLLKSLHNSFRLRIPFL
ncbi:MAG: hypothetical protein ACFE9L_05345 [Candidatus Hodarchaeota archaeon]